MSFKNLKLSIFLVAFVFVAQSVTGQTLPNANVWGNTLLSAKTENSDTSGSVSISQLNNALYYNINNIVNVPTANRIIYSNGTNLTSNSGLTYSGSSFGVTGTGVFTGTVSGANAASAGHFTTLSQLQSAVSGTTNYIPKLTGTNTIGNSSIQDDGNRIKISGKPIHNEFSANSSTYRDVHAYNTTTASTTGAFAIELPTGVNGQMLTFEITGYTYDGGSAWQLYGGAYVYNGNSWINPHFEASGKAPFSVVSLAYNATTNRVILILGEITTTWRYPQIYISKVTSGFSNSSTLATGWSSSFVTSLAAYTNKTDVTVVKSLSNQQVNIGTKDNAGSWTPSGFYDTNIPTNYYTGASSWQHIIESRHTNVNNNYAMQIAGSFFDQDFYGRKTNNSATTAWSKFITSSNFNATGDARYLGIGATAANATLLNSQSASYYTNATNINAGTLPDARLSANVSLDNQDNNFSVNQTIPNASADGHALNRITGDGRFLGLTATATNSNALRGLDTNVIAQRNQLNDFTQRNRFFSTTSFSGSVFFNNAADYTPFNEDTDKIFVMKGDGELRSKNIRDIINDVSVNDTFALTGNTGAVFNLSSYATTVVDLGLYTSTMGSNNVIEFRLASGNPYYHNQQITVTASGQIICGQGSKIRLADNSGTTLVQACNDQLSALTEPYEFTDNPLRNFSITFQYSKKRNLWRVANFKNWGDL